MSPGCGDHEEMPGGVGSTLWPGPKNMQLCYFCSFNLTRWDRDLFGLVIYIYMYFFFSATAGRGLGQSKNVGS